MKVLVVQGAGMELRGKVDVDIFGPQTLDEINARIEADARLLGIAVDVRHTNVEDEAARWILEATDEFDALIINPSGFTTTEGPLVDALRAAALPAVEVHASNPAARGVRSSVTPVCQAAVCGFGYDGYRVALAGLLGDE